MDVSISLLIFFLGGSLFSAFSAVFSARDDYIRGKQGQNLHAKIEKCERGRENLSFWLKSFEKGDGKKQERGRVVQKKQKKTIKFVKKIVLTLGTERGTIIVTGILDIHKSILS